MKILVCISKVPDTTTKIAFTENDTKFNEDKVQWILNPYDEWYALVRALELKEAQGGSVTVLNVGPAANDQVIRKALAIGAENAVRIDAEPTDSLAVAQQIAAHVKEEGYDMVLCGKETIDHNASSVGAMIAELMDWPFVSLITNLEVANGTATMTREIEGGKESCEVALPMVGSSQKGMAEARIPNMRGIMQARTKPLKVVPAVATSQNTTVVSYELPPAKGDCTYIDAENVGELVNLLHNDAKVI